MLVQCIKIFESVQFKFLMNNKGGITKKLRPCLHSAVPSFSSPWWCFLDHYLLTPMFIQLIKTSRLKLDLQQSILIFAR